MEITYAHYARLTGCATRLSLRVTKTLWKADRARLGYRRRRHMARLAAEMEAIEAVFSLAAKWGDQLGVDTSTARKNAATAGRWKDYAKGNRARPE
jgi:hypothetical protein